MFHVLAFLIILAVAVLGYLYFRKGLSPKTVVTDVEKDLTGDAQKAEQVVVAEVKKVETAVVDDVKAKL